MAILGPTHAADEERIRRRMATNHYEIPTWAGKPKSGLHLDVLKEGKLIQKLMIDEKKCYLFGRNPNLNDICIDHASCSRVHAALVYHKHLDRAFLIDLGSTHGTFIGSIRIEANKPTQLPIDSTFHFGASTRQYILREKPSQNTRTRTDSDQNIEDSENNLNLPESEIELDNLTEFNTAHNRRISMLGIPDEEKPTRKRKNVTVTFKEEEDIINPEDIDPSVGKFRNLVQTAVIPKKKIRIEKPENRPFHILRPGGGGTESTLAAHHTISPLFSSSISSKLGIHLPNPAPDVDIEKPVEESIDHLLTPSASTNTTTDTNINEPKKKKYAKEAWPGKKSSSLLL